MKIKKGNNKTLNTLISEEKFACAYSLAQEYPFFLCFIPLFICMPGCLLRKAVKLASKNNTPTRHPTYRQTARHMYSSVFSPLSPCCQC